MPGRGASTSTGRSTLWSFAGIAVPIPVALVSIPLLIEGLGQERFGILTIAWALMGYFGVFDFGMSRATTGAVAQVSAGSDREAVARIYWSSSAAHLALGLVGGLVLFLAAPVVEGMLAVDPALRDEARVALQLLAVSVPVVVLTSVARGLLEAMHRFDLVNAIKIPASVVTYLGPVLTLWFSTSLVPVVGVILAGRIAVLVSYMLLGWRVVPQIRQAVAPQRAIVRTLAATGGWMTIGTLLVPAMVSVDRLVLGSVVSVAVVAAYAAPYEVVTKLWIFSGSLLAVLFPRFAVADEEVGREGRLYWLAVAVLTILTAPAAAVIMAFAPEFFTAWLGGGIGSDAVIAARWLAAGVAVNVVAQVPYTALQARGQAALVGKLQLAELVAYLGMAWIGATVAGLAGVAMAWAGRALVDAVALFAIAARRLPVGHHAPPHGLVSTVGMAAGLLVWAWQIEAFAPGWAGKGALLAIGLAVFAAHVVRRYDVDVRRLAFTPRSRPSLP